MSEARLVVDDRTWVLVLTGAGVSAESGIPTFRDLGGVWQQYPVEQVASPQGFRDDPQLVWAFYSERRRRGKSCEPNPGHLALVDLEQRLGDRFLLVTQNVDGLHRRAGSRRLLEIHGQLYQSRCAHCDRTPFDDERSYDDAAEPPLCAACRDKGRLGLVRPNIVWFGESLDARHFATIGSFIEAASVERLVFLAAGTSGAVFPANTFVDQASSAGAETWLVNAEPADNAGHFDHFVRGRSGEVLPSLFAH
jgi:NAD-dependent deacetylase